MKVFLSWSGDISHQIAVSLREWFPLVIQSIEPYVSSEDIDKGTRWSTDISKELESSFFGVICVTQENLNAPWINFEAGALSKTIESTKVCPFLFGIKRSEIHGPLLQFQSTIFEKEDFKKMLHSINDSMDVGALDNELLEKSFEMWWPELEKKLSPLLQTAQQCSINMPTHVNNNDILEELLELARSQQKLLRSPEELLPSKYIADALGKYQRIHQPMPIRPLRDIKLAAIDAKKYLESKSALTNEDLIELSSNLSRIVEISDYLYDRYSLNKNRQRFLELDEFIERS